MILEERLRKGGRCDWCDKVRGGAAVSFKLQLFSVSYFSQFSFFAHLAPPGTADFSWDIAAVYMRDAASLQARLPNKEDTEGCGMHTCDWTKFQDHTPQRRLCDNTKLRVHTTDYWSPAHRSAAPQFLMPYRAFSQAFSARHICLQLCIRRTGFA